MHTPSILYAYGSVWILVLLKYLGMLFNNSEGGNFVKSICKFILKLALLCSTYDIAINGHIYLAILILTIKGKQ